MSIFTGEWDDVAKSTISTWIVNKLTDLQGEAPEDLFVDYVIVMIGNGKGRTEISDELKEFLGEEEALNFVAELSGELEKLGAKSKDKPAHTKSKIVSLGKSDSKPSSVVSLKGSSGSKDSGGSRLLLSALQSSRESQQRSKPAAAGGGADRESPRGISSESLRRGRDVSIGDDVHNKRQKIVQPGKQLGTLSAFSCTYLSVQFSPSVR
jgi:hypothetical protein